MWYIGTYYDSVKDRLLSPPGWLEILWPLAKGARKPKSIECMELWSSYMNEASWSYNGASWSCSSWILLPFFGACWVAGRVPCNWSFVDSTLHGCIYRTPQKLWSLQVFPKRLGTSVSIEMRGTGRFLLQGRYEYTTQAVH